MKQLMFRNFVEANPRVINLYFYNSPKMEYKLCVIEQASAATVIRGVYIYYLKANNFQHGILGTLLALFSAP